MSKFPIIILSGYSGADKSTVGSIFCDRYGLDFIEHQPLVHGIAKSKGFERARYWLAEVGVGKFSQESVAEMIKIIKSLEESTRGILTDVSYGTEMVESLRQSFPEADLVVVSVVAETSTRELRIARRMGGVEREVAHKEKEFRNGFLHEVGLDVVINSADFVIENTRGIDGVVSELRSKLELRGWTF